MAKVLPFDKTDRGGKKRPSKLLHRSLYICFYKSASVIVTYFLCSAHTWFVSVQCMFVGENNTVDRRLALLSAWSLVPQQPRVKAKMSELSVMLLFLSLNLRENHPVNRQGLPKHEEPTPTATTASAHSTRCRHMHPA